MSASEMDTSVEIVNNWEDFRSGRVSGRVVQLIAIPTCLTSEVCSIRLVSVKD